jgi:hypothetical protein
MSTEPARRHPGTEHLLSLFEFEHLPSHLRRISAPCHELANDMALLMDDGPELTAGLRKLLEAKDCFVRQAVVDAKARERA